MVNPRAALRLPEHFNTGIAEQDASKLVEIEGLDVSRGIFFSGGTVESYLDVLAVFLVDGREKIKEINLCLVTGNLPLYKTYVHALKSACANIGANDLSDAAKKLEIACKLDDLGYIGKYNPFLLAGLESVLNNIHDFLKRNRETKKTKTESFDAEAFKAWLFALKTGIKTFDAGVINKTIDSLKKSATTEETYIAVENITNNVLIADYDKAIELIEELTCSLSPKIV